jgi:pimeloyl-ACP methyl ester carboxylesterase
MGHTPAMQIDAIRHNFADVNGVRLHYASAGVCAGTGVDTGKLILFLHGFPEFWYAWRNQLIEFGKNSLAVAPDLRGYNLSSKPEEVERYKISELARDIRELIAHLGVESCSLVGHDWGGVVAWAVAMAFPEAVEKLVIINAPHPAIFERELRENPAQQQASQYMLIFRNTQAEVLLTANNFANMQETVLGEGLKQGLFTEADRQAYLEAWSQPGAITGGLNYYRASEIGPPGGAGEEGAGLSANFSSMQVKAPTLVIWGEKDPYLLTGNLDGLDRYVSKLSVERIPDATHWVVHEKPALVNSLIRSFITR